MWICIAGCMFILFTDGAYLGKNVVRFFYTMYAPIYDIAKPLTWLRNRQIRTILRKYVLPRTGTHLDVATGTGRMVHILLHEKDWGGTHIALDYTPKMLDVAMKRTPRNARHLVSYALGDANELNMQKTFSLVTCLEALEIVENPPDALTRLAEHVEPGGFLLVTKVRDSIGLFMPSRALRRKKFENILTHKGLEILIYKNEFGSRYELCLARKRPLPAPARPTSA